MTVLDYVKSKGYFVKHYADIKDFEDELKFIRNGYIVDDYPVYKGKLPQKGEKWDLSNLIYPQYCMAWIEWYFGGWAESYQRDLDAGYPVNLDMIIHHTSKLPYIGAEKFPSWPEPVYAAAEYIYKAMQECAIKSGILFAKEMSLEEFMKYVNSSKFHYDLPKLREQERTSPKPRFIKIKKLYQRLKVAYCQYRYEKTEQ